MYIIIGKSCSLSVCLSGTALQHGHRKNARIGGRGAIKS